MQCSYSFCWFESGWEATKNPLNYNVRGTLSLLEAMKATQVKKIIFSSSATIYSAPDFLLFTENHPLRAMSPYGRSKLMVEQILSDLYNSDQSWFINILRYFDPVGAHDSGLIGEDPKGIPNYLMPYIAQVASGKKSHLNIWG